MIQISHLDFMYSSGESVLQDINLEIKEGEVLSIIGKNGAGKSSLLRLIAGLIQPTNGEIKIDDISVQDKKREKEIRKKLGIVFQNPDNQILFPNVYNDIEFALKNLGIENRDEKIHEALKKVGMEDYINKDTYELSLGQKQRINIASVLAVGPKYILLDEPTTMIDSKGKDAIYNVIEELKKQGFTIVFVTNQMNEILLSDRILVLENKQIKTIFNKKEILDKVEILEQSDIKIPEIIEILLNLKKKNMPIHLEEWTMQEMINEIVRMCKK